MHTLVARSVASTRNRASSAISPGRTTWSGSVTVMPQRPGLGSGEKPEAMSAMTWV